MTNSPVDQSQDVLADLASALDRLRKGTPLIVRGSYLINQSTVCREAGRHRSSIKNSDKFIQLRKEIDEAAKLLEAARNKPATRDDQTAKRIESLARQNLELEKSLDDAGLMILRLYSQLQSLEDDRRYILERVAHARTTNRSVDKVFRVMNFDELIVGSLD